MSVVFALLMLLVAAPSWAMENHSEVLRDQFGRAIGGATVKVYLVGTTTLATIYSDNGVSVRSNPFLTDTFTGRYNFYAANGVYDLVFTYPDVTFNPEHTKRIALFDVNDFSGGGGGGGSGIGTGAVFPTNPSANLLFFLTSAGAVGECDDGVGTATTLCEFDGVNWKAVNYVPAADTLATVTQRGNTSTGNDETNPFELFGSLAQIANGMAFERTSAGESRWRCKEPAGLNKCNYYRQLDSGFSAGYKDSAGNIDFRYDESTGKITVMTANEEDAGVAFTRAEESHWDVAGCDNTTAGPVFNRPVSASPTAVCEGTNTRLATLDFNDSTDQGFHGRWKLPAGFQPSLGIDIHGTWKASATTGATGWCFQMVRVPDGATSDPAQPAQSSSNCVSDTAKSTTLQENTFTITNVTCTSCVAGDSVNWILSRDANGSAVTDSMAGDAKLITFGRTWRFTK